MDKATSDSAIVSIVLDRKLDEPLHMQLTMQIRRLILTRRLNPGQRIPSSRALAEELSVSRVTVTTAFDQLISEGYIESRRGSGVYVAHDLPDYLTKVHPVPGTDHSVAASDNTNGADRQIRPFEVSIPDLKKFPYAEWSRLFDRVWRAPKPDLLAKPDPFGSVSLRRAISRHLYDWRGIDCVTEQIVMTSGIVETVEIITREILQAGDIILMEEPGYDILRRAFRMNKLNCQPVRVDDQGFDIELASKLHPDAKSVAVTPSRHYPLGMTLPLSRRLNLLDWANRTNGIIIEDDFDGEYRYQGQPLPALMSLDDRECVFYVGSFSKVIFPALRLSYFVLPRRFVTSMRNSLTSTGTRASLMLQPVLAEFIENGMLATHIRRMRRLYARRQEILAGAISDHLSDYLETETAPAGMHLVTRFKPAVLDRCSESEIVAQARSSGLTLRPLSGYFTSPNPPKGLVLGFAAFDEAEINQGIKKLGSIFKSQTGKARSPIQSEK